MELKDRKSYTFDEVLPIVKDYFKGDELSAKVWINKYALKDSYGNIYEKDPSDMHRRIAGEIHRIEKKYENPLSEDEIFEVLDDFKYIIPQGSPMAGIGNDFQTVSLSNCFVVGEDNPSDSYGGILKIDEEQVQLMKRRGGVGHDLSHLRPAGTPVKNSALTSTGIVPFMERYSNSTREVAQDGRRGALMLTLSIDHPDAEGFIDAKMTEGKITGANVSVKMTDAFMDVALKGEKYIQKFPIDSKEPKITKEIDAGALWKKIVRNAWQSAEPGILFWDKVLSESPADCYADMGFRTISTNPCIIGDTLIATADGRNAVSIKTLVEEGKDVPVYSLDNNGKVVIRMMRNPRITGYNQPIYKVTLDDGNSVKVTGNHKFYLKDGSYKETKNLKYGDSLDIMTKSISPIVINSDAPNKYVWIKGSKDKIRGKSEHRMIYEFNNGVDIPKGHVIHHKDFDSLNNSPDNLVMMTKEEHDNYNGELMKGKNNPYHKFEHVKEALNKAASHPKERNGRYSGYTHDQIKGEILSLTKKLNKRISKSDWIEYSKDKGLPMSFSGWRKNHLNNMGGLFKWAAVESGILKEELKDIDSRILNRYSYLLSEGYDCFIENGNILFNKRCEICGKEYITGYQESGVCSHKCGTKKVWLHEEGNKKRAESRKKFENNKKEILTEQQVKAYSDLKFELKRDPMLKEWIGYCKEKEIRPDLRKTATNVEGWKGLKELAETYNHKVVSVEFDGYENVYNGTVDDYHNFYIGGFYNSEKNIYQFIRNRNCGEIPLCANDSCRLLAINLYSYVKNPFTKEAEFDFDLFKNHVMIAVKMMDDIIDLEIEKIDRIIKKIKNDPEPSSIKSTELELWKKILKKTEKGRRTGIGVTAEGDMLAALGYTYGKNNATDFAEKVHRELALTSYKTSILLAKERGSFPIWEFEREFPYSTFDHRSSEGIDDNSNNPFLRRIFKEIFKEDDGRIWWSDYQKYGRRNISMLTIAPTGSVSMMTQTTSGIEPVFMPFYKRNRKVNPNDRDVKISFTDKNGDSWEQYIVFHPKFLKWLKIKKYDVDEVKLYDDEDLKPIIKKSPYYRSTTEDVDWVSKVKMQGKIQQWVDHSISVTVNLPNDISEEIVSKVYETAWKSGCKGITVYRDGSRSGVLIKNNEKNNRIIKTQAPKRPKELPCNIHHVTALGKQWVVIVGMLDGEPYEVFAFKEKNISISKNITEGKLVKVKSGHYSLVIEGDGYLDNVSTLFERAEEEALTRMISVALRHGADIKFIVEQLNKSEGNVVSFGKAIARTLKKYLKDGDLKEKKKCPSCGDPDGLVYKEGCVTCKSCSYSECN